MKKQYITPYIKGHKIVVKQLICGSPQRDEQDFGGGGGDIGIQTCNSSKSYYRGSFFDDEEPAQSSTKEQDFAYGL